MQTEQTADPDAALVAAAKAGSRDAFEHLVRRHAASVYRRVYGILKNEADAADVTQETLVSAHAKLDTFRQESRFATWLQRIATNQALMKLRAGKRRKEAAIDDLLPAFVEDGHHVQQFGVFVETSALDERLARVDLARQAVAQLPDNYREILVLRVGLELTTEETASELQISTTAVKLRLHRAHQALRTLLAEQLEVQA